MIFGKWKPRGAAAACLLFGAAKGFEIFLGATDLKIASEILAMLPYVLTLVILVGFVGKAVAPRRTETLREGRMSTPKVEPKTEKKTSLPA
jgi:ABC-type uncharacterized transport system permease subunit